MPERQVSEAHAWAAHLLHLHWQPAADATALLLAALTTATLTPVIMSRRNSASTSVDSSVVMRKPAGTARP